MQPEQRTKLRQASLRLLVVEDDEDDFFLIDDLLRHGLRNVEVKRASSVEDALVQAKQRTYDVFICDYRLGRYTGLDLLRRLQDSQVAAPVIILTGQGDEEVAVEAMKAGAVDYLLKSKLNASALTQALSYALELQKKEAAVREAHEALRAIHQASPLSVIALDLQGNVQSINPATQRLFGWSAEEMVGHPAPVPEERRELFRAMLARAARGDVVVGIEGWARRKDNTRMDISLSMAPLRDARNRVTGVVSVVADISEQTQSEQALRTSEERYRTLFERNLAGVYRSTLEGRLLDCNQALASIFGFPSREQALEHSALELYADPRDRQRLVEKLLDDGLVVNLESRGCDRQGRPVWLLENASLVADEHGQRQLIEGTVIDITERKQAEEAIQASEERYRLLFERNLAGVVRTRLDGSIVECNDAMARMLGFESCQQAMASNIASLYEQPEQRQKLLERLLAGGDVVNEEVDMRRRDGSHACLLTNISLQRDENGNPSYLEATVLDITQRRVLEQQLVQAQKMEAVGQLAGGIAHDFNNLLLVMSGYAELLMDSMPPDPKLRRNAEEILKAARRAATLTAQLLAFSRKQVLSPQVLNLNSVLEEMAKMLPRLIGENIEVKLLLGADLWKVKADPVQIEQVLMNLAVNARDAMPEGGQLTLETANLHLDEEYVRRHAEVAAGDYVMLAVTDTGRGIPPDVLPHVFEPFFTTKEKGKGTGLGLPTVYGIVKQSGGFIWVYSEVGHGTVLKIYLPRDQGAKETLAPPAGPEAPARGSETILLVEDEEAVREAAAEYLTLRGYTVMQAENGIAALQIAQRFQGGIDLVISDVVMPGMGGPELASRLRPLRPQTRVLYVSGYTEATALQRNGAPDFDFLQKPFTLNALGRKARELLDNRPTAAPSDGSATI